MAYDDFTAKMVSRVHELEKALAEKDREIQQIREHEFQSGYRDGEAFREKAYHALMGQGVRFAEVVRDIPGKSFLHDDALKFLASPEVRTWREKERKI